MNHVIIHWIREEHIHSYLHHKPISVAKVPCKAAVGHPIAFRAFDHFSKVQWDSTTLIFLRFFFFLFLFDSSLVHPEVLAKGFTATSLAHLKTMFSW